MSEEFVENNKVNWWNISQCLEFAEKLMENEFILSREEEQVIHKAFKELNKIVENNPKNKGKVIKITCPVIKM